MKRNATYSLNIMLLVIWSLTTTSKTNAEDSSSTNSTAECNDWYLFNDYCYKVYMVEMYQKEAESKCQSHNSQLVSISNPRENEYVQSIVAKHTVYKEVWIGLKKSGAMFRWLDGGTGNYSNWLINKPSLTAGDCVRMILNGYWSNLICYHRLPFVCKRRKNPPIIVDNLALILNISIPLSCIFIMCLFVGFLCFRSYKELSDIKADNLDGKPFEIIQAAMILPMKKAPDLLTSTKGKNLWKGAIEKLKAEQIKNNPFNDPGTFLKRSSSNDLIDGSTNNNKSLQESQDSATLADIVNSLLKKRRETVTTGLLGAPTGLPKVPSISVTEPNRNKKRSSSNSSSNSSFSNTMSSSSTYTSRRGSETEHCETDIETIIYNNNNTPQVYESKVDIWLRKKLSNTLNIQDEEDYTDNNSTDKQNVIQNRANESNDDNRSDGVDVSSDDQEKQMTKNSRCDSNFVEVVVDVNRNPTAVRPKRTSSEIIIQTNRKALSPPTILSSQHGHLDLIPSEPIPVIPLHSNNSSNSSINSIHNMNDNNNNNTNNNINNIPDCSFKRSTSIRDSDRVNNYMRGSVSSTASSIEEQTGVFGRKSFRNSVREESYRRKDRYFPSTSSENCERDFSDVVLPPLIHQNGSDYTQITLV